jgi:hypothetical protein
MILIKCESEEHDALELIAGEDEALLVGRNALLVRTL